MIPKENLSNFNFLSIIVDLNEIFWANQYLKQNSDTNDQFNVQHFVQSMISFSNAYILANTFNHLNIIACTASQSYLLFNSLENIKFDDATIDMTNSYTNFQYLYNLSGKVISNLKLMLNHSEATPQKVINGSLIATPLMQSLSIINKFEKQISKLGQASSNRILIIKTDGETSFQYLDIMNAIFAAQKMNVTIDTCLLNQDSDILHQISFMTGGKYSKIYPLSGLLQYLLWLYLSPPNFREKNLVMPPDGGIDFRASCFCHRKLLDVGFVCSSCFAVFCGFTPFCSMCNAHFKIPSTN